MRLFIGMALSNAVVHELLAVVSRLRTAQSKQRSSTSRLRNTAPESWHLTLQFLGATTQEQLECLISRLGAVQAPPVPLRLGELGSFHRAGVVFVDIAVTPELTALRQKVVDATSQCGFAIRKLPFHPHITLMRFTGHGLGLGPRELMSGTHGSPEFSSFTAREFLLYESHLGRYGARYEVLARFPLGSAHS